MKKLILILITLFFAVSLAAQDIDSIVADGINNYNHQNYKTAYDKFKQAMKINPNHPEASKWFWKMKAEHDVKNLTDRGPIEEKKEVVAAEKKEVPAEDKTTTPVKEEVRTAVPAEEKKAVSEAKEEKPTVASEKAVGAKKEETAGTEEVRKIEIVNLSKLERAEYIRKMNEMEGSLTRRIVDLNRQVVSLKGELGKKKAFDAEAPVQEPARTPATEAAKGSWFTAGNVTALALFIISLVLLLLAIAGIAWSRRRNKRIPAPPPAERSGPQAGYARETEAAAPEIDNRAVVMDLARRFMNSPDRDMKVVAPLLSHLIKSDGRAGADEALRTTSQSEGRLLGPCGSDTGINSSIEVFANSFLFLLEKKLKRGNEALKVKALSGEIGLRLGLSQNELQELRVAALLRDTGFLVVPQNLLLKKGPLTAQEMKEVRKHVAYSGKIAQFMSLPERVVNIITNHQERFNGSGYPNGSSGEEIPFGARILAPCDAYVSLTSPRPFRRTLTSEQAVLKLQDEGNLFDPNVFRVFQDVIHSKLLLRENTLETDIA